MEGGIVLREFELVEEHSDHRDLNIHIEGELGEIKFRPIYTGP